MCKLNIAMAVTNISYDRSVIEGALDFARNAGNMELHVWGHWHPGSGRRGLPANAAMDLKLFRISGVLVDIWSPLMREHLRHLGVPVVDVGGGFSCPNVPAVHVDNAAVAQAAARHLMDRGLRNFGFWGQDGLQHAADRQRAFVAELAKGGFTCSTIEKRISSGTWSEQSTGPATRWLKSLPKPVGIMCWHDGTAVIAQYICRRIGLGIPDEVALIGVENDDMCQLMCPVPLTTVDVNAHRIGYQAMDVLSRLIRRRSMRCPLVLLPPGNILARRSTDVTAIDDTELVEAIRFIQDNADKPISVRDVLRKVPISRRRLEIHFKKILHRTPRQHIRHLHIERAKTLIENYDLSMSDVAQMSGFRSQAALSKLFKQSVKCTPVEYRRQVGSTHRETHERLSHP